MFGGDGYTSGISYYVPQRFPVDNVTNIAGGRSILSSTSTFYFAYSSPTDTTEFRYNYDSTGSGGPKSVNSFNRGSNISIFQDNIARGLAFITNDNAILFYNSANNPDLYPDVNVIKALPVIHSSIGNSNNAVGVRFLSDDGRLFEHYLGTTSQIGAELGFITNFWSDELNTSIVFALNSENKLFAKGYNGQFQLGFPDSSAFQNNFVYLGFFNAKKIENGFLLTQDGKLFHTGQAISGISAAHNQWTHIFQDYRFLDFAYDSFIAYLGGGTQTLTVLLKEVP